MKPSCVRILLIANLVDFLLTTAAMSQKAATNPATGVAGVQVADGHIPDVLHQFDKSLQALAAKVSPAVVQITVTAFGPEDEKGKDGVSLIVRRHAFGAGVILDPDRYIMTHHHLVDGARQIR